MNAGGTDQRRITENNALDGDPVCSSDGSTIAFTSEVDGDGRSSW